MSELKYLYACLKDGTVVSISDADKSQEYYLYPGKQVKLILRQGQVYQKHFAVKSEDLQINGNRVRFNSINESPQHYNFKMNILKEGYFIYKEYKILIKNAKVEPRILNSSYRADVFGELLCGTPCIIEVINTSKVSEEKKEFINENQILTFEIIIDKDGNQIIEESNCYGNTEIASIQEQTRRIKFIYNQRNNTRTGITDRNLEIKRDRSKREFRINDIRERKIHTERAILEYQQSNTTNTTRLSQERDRISREIEKLEEKTSTLN
jgi:hypothetical protein